MLLATYFAMPVSTTHAIVGAVLGMTVTGAGAACVRWGYPGLLTIVASWFISPVLAGLLSAAMHLAIQRGVFKVLLNSTPVSVHSACHENAGKTTATQTVHYQLLSNYEIPQHTKCQLVRLPVQANDPFAVAMRALPILYGASVGTVLSLVLLKAQTTQAWPSWLTALITIAVTVAVGIAVQLLLVPQMHRKISSWGEVGQVPLSDRARQVEAGSEPRMFAL